MTEELHEEIAEEISEEIHEEISEESNEEIQPAPIEEEKVTFDERQQEVFNSEIAKKVRATKEAQRETADLKYRLEQLEAKQPKQLAPEIPAIPDQYDEDYTSKVAARDLAISQKANYDYQQRVQSEASLKSQQDSRTEATQRSTDAINSYVDRAEKLGHKREDVIESTQYIMDVGLGRSAQAYIRDDTNGPDVARYLAKNPSSLDEVMDMPDYMAVAHIASIVKPKAMSSFRKQTKIPEPTDHLRGKGAAEGNDGPPGATFT